MKTKNRLVLLASLAAAALLAGCGGNGGGSGGGSADANFDEFVIDLVQNRTSDTTDPVELNDRTFRFDDDPAAFDSLFR